MLLWKREVVFGWKIQKPVGRLVLVVGVLGRICLACFRARLLARSLCLLFSVFAPTSFCLSVCVLSHVSLTFVLSTYLCVPID